MDWHSSNLYCSIVNCRCQALDQSCAMWWRLWPKWPGFGFCLLHGGLEPDFFICQWEQQQYLPYKVVSILHKDTLCSLWCWHVVSAHMWVKIKWNKYHSHVLDKHWGLERENNSQLGSSEVKFQTQSIRSLTPCPSPFSFTYFWGCRACTQLSPTLS